MTIFIQIVFILILISISAFCSSAEMALFSLRHSKILSYKDSPDPVQHRIWELMDGQHLTLITIIFCNMFVNSMVSMLNESVLEQLHLPPAVTLAVSAFTGIMILLLFGEVSPMTVAYVYSERWSRICATPVYVMRKLFYPLTHFVAKFCDMILQWMGKPKPQSLVPEEYLSFIEIGQERGFFTHEEAKLMKETFALRNKTVESVMRNRSDLSYVTRQDSPETVSRMIRQHSQAYLPVSSELRLDSSDAILSARLFFSLPAVRRANWSRSSCVLDQTVFIPEKTTLEKALRTMKNTNVYAALAADEYGAVTGVITREDIYSELTGRSVELDEQADWLISRISDRRWLFNGLCTLEFLRNTVPLHWDPERFEAATLNGVFCELLGDIPRQGDHVSFDNVTLLAAEVNGNRVAKVMLTIHDPATQSGGAES